MSDPIDIPPTPEASLVRISSRTAAILLIFTVVFTALMALTYTATKPVLEASAEAERLKLIDELLPRSEYDNALLKDTIYLPAEPALGMDEPTQAWRARRNGMPVALIIQAAAPDGYSGRIGLILAVRSDGRLAAVRVTQHRETPGLGDYIDPKKDRNKPHPWIGQFNEHDLAHTPVERWKVKKDGGVYDQRAGATISARAVTNATQRALAWITPRIDRLFAVSTDVEYQE